MLLQSLQNSGHNNVVLLCGTLYTYMEYVIYLILMVDICFCCNQMLYHRNMPLLAGNEQWCPAILEVSNGATNLCMYAIHIQYKDMKNGKQTNPLCILYNCICSGTPSINIVAWKHESMLTSIIFQIMMVCFTNKFDMTTSITCHYHHAAAFTTCNTGSHQLRCCCN